MTAAAVLYIYIHYSTKCYKNFLFQSVGEKSIISGKNSSLPRSISALKIIFVKSESAEKFQAGPTMLPRPGPTFPTQVITDVIVVVKSRFSNETKSMETRSTAT